MANKKQKGSRPQKVTVTGQVVGPKDEPIDELKIQVEVDGVTKRRLKTHDDGTFKVSVVCGSRVRVDYPAATPGGLVLPRETKVECRPEADEALQTVKYHCAGTISGVVEYETVRDGQICWVPLPDLSVRLEVGKSGSSTANTDLKGRFELPHPGGGQSAVLSFPEKNQRGVTVLFLDDYERPLAVEPTRSLALPETVRYSQVRASLSVMVTGGGKGLPGVPVRLAYLDPGGPAVRDTETDKGGCYTFTNLFPGKVKILVPPYHRDDQLTRFTLPAAQRTQQVITLKGGDNAAAKPIAYTEEHRIVWTVSANKEPVVDVLVEVRDAGGQKVMGAQRTNPAGLIDLPVPEAGDYQVRVYADGGAEPLDTQVVHVGSTLVGVSNLAAVVPAPAPAAGAPPARPAPPPPNGARESLIDATAYPILTEEVTFPTPAPRSSGGAPGSAALGQAVDSALRDVLGWRIKANDPKGFTAALTQSFTLKQVEGHVEASWVPRSYAVQVQADLGAITGAQASIYARAKVALDQSLPLLDGITSLRVDIPAEDQEATRTIVRTELTQLVNELGIEGGPRVQRVDELFGYLLGLQPPPLPPAAPAQTPATAEQLVILQESRDNPQAVGKLPPWALPAGWPVPPPTTHLGELGLRFGMQRRRMNTIEDEQNLTNFIILVDYFTGLWQTWVAQRQYFDRIPQQGVQPYFGTQMVLLSRALVVVGESVQEVNFTMDSVFLGPAERQTLRLVYGYPPAGVVPPNFPLLYLPGVPSAGQQQRPVPPQTHSPYHFASSTSPLYLAELLDWIDRVATEEGPRLIQDAGKDGVVALKPTLDSLRTFARGALLHPHGVQHAGLPKGYATPRVQRAVRELADSLDTVLTEAVRIRGLRLPNE